MPQEKKPQFNVVSDLKELSEETDQVINEDQTSFSISKLHPFFEEVKRMIIQIRDCSSISEIGEPPPIRPFLHGIKEKNRNKEVVVSEKEHVHTAQPEVANKNEKDTNSKRLSSSVTESKNSQFNNKYEKKGTPSVNSTVVSTPVNALQKNNSTINSPACVQGSNSNKSHILMETPLLNKTVTKVIKKKIYESSTPSNLTVNTHENGSSGVVTRSGSKKKTPTNKNKREDNSSCMITRSGSKRKSSPNKNAISKKPKTCVSNAQTATRPAQSRQPLVDKNIMKTAVTLSTEKSKMNAVIVPPVIQKKSAVSKEMLVLEEIRKKEEKANENKKRILAERQLKAEQNKKAREEKRVQTLQKRMQMQKEKEQLQKTEIKAKNSQVKPTSTKEILNSAPKKTRTQELIDQHASSSYGKRTNDIPKTPAHDLSRESDNYDLTPVPNSSTYSYSDDEEDDQKAGKRIPSWAQGVQLKNTLFLQHYNPPDLDELFGTEIEPPDLCLIFGGAPKPQYLKRTSSAVWNSPPLCV